MQGDQWQPWRKMQGLATFQCVPVEVPALSVLQDAACDKVQSENRLKIRIYWDHSHCPPEAIADNTSVSALHPQLCDKLHKQGG